jgi:hypothetical protein
MLRVSLCGVESVVSTGIQAAAAESTYWQTDDGGAKYAMMRIRELTAGADK